MGIYLYGFDARMVKRILNTADVGPRLEQVCRVAMAQHVWRDRPCDPRTQRGLLHHLLEASRAVLFMLLFSLKKPRLIGMCLKTCR